MAQILLTGISGFVAKHVALHLLNAGHHVRGTLRRLDRSVEVTAALAPLLEAGAADRLTFAQADLEDDAGWAQAMAGSDVVVHTASPFPLAQPKHEDDLLRPAREGTLRVLRAAKAAGTGRIVLTSSTAAVLSDDFDGLADESRWCNTELSTTTAYAKSKTLAERAAWAFCNDNGLALTTINPGLVLGAPLDGAFGSSVALIQRIMKGKDPMMPALAFPVVDVRDVAEMHLRAVDRPELAGSRFIASAGHLSMVQMARAIKAWYPTRRLPTLQAPRLLVQAIALFDPSVRAILPKLGRREEVTNRHAVARMGMDFIPPEQALRATASWLADHGKVWV